MSNFSEYATSTALNISLSKNQVEMLCAYAQGFRLTTHGSFITTLNALNRKGFVESAPYCRHDKYDRVESIYYKQYLTKAGEIMIELIKEAGLYVEFKEDEFSEGTAAVNRVA